MLGLALIPVSSSIALAQINTETICRVEEDWEVVVDQPDLVSSGPQITTTMSPQGDNSKSFVAFNVNYRDYPFIPGGLQILAWTGMNTPEVIDSTRKKALSTPGERIAWTQRMEVENGELRYIIKDGTSTTWGSFGFLDFLSVRFPTTVSSLDDYSPDRSLKWSGVSWQANLVSQMTLLRVRYYNTNGELLRTEDTPRPVPLATTATTP